MENAVFDTPRTEIGKNSPFPASNGWEGPPEAPTSAFSTSPTCWPTNCRESPRRSANEPASPTGLERSASRDGRRPGILRKTGDRGDAGGVPGRAFRVLPPVEKPGDALDADVTRWIERARPMLGVVHADPNNAYVPEILDSISDDTDAFLVGGLTSSRGRHAQLADSVVEGGVCGALFAGSVPVTCGLSQGCAPVGAFTK